MATRFYKQSTAYGVFVPTVDAAWGTTAGSIVRAQMHTTSAGTAGLNIDFDDADANALSIALYQASSLKLTAGQTITGGQALKRQDRWRQFALTNNMFPAWVLRVIAADGVTVRKTLLALTLDNNEMHSTALRNRQFTATSAAGDYVTVDGDRLVEDSGGSGDPDAGGTHHIRIAVGDAQASDLPEDDSDQTDLRSWTELADTLTFVADGGGFILGGGVGGGAAFVLGA